VTSLVGTSRVKRTDRIITARGRMARARLKIRRRAPLPRKSACCVLRKQITLVAPKFAQMSLTSADGRKNDGSFRSKTLKNRSHRVSTVVSRSTIFSHRDRISARNKPDFNVGRNSDRNGRYPASPPLRHHAVPKKRYSGFSLGRETRTSRRKLVPHDGTVTTDSRTVVIPRSTSRVFREQDYPRTFFRYNGFSDPSIFSFVSLIYTGD